jgi:hypothetical protein
MHAVFKVSKAEIQQLDDKQARELIARLCSAELQKNGFSPAGVNWGGDQRAKDGGVDVRVTIDANANISGYIPRPNTIFQVKAVKAFKAANIRNEMGPKIKGAVQRRLLSCISELAPCSGAYVIASTKGDLSDSALLILTREMGACINAEGLTGQIHLDFYDSQKIATWAEQHPAIVIWIKSVLGNSVVGWKPYTAWAFREQNVHAEYILDDKVKIVAASSTDAITIVDAIKKMRQDLQCEKKSVRIVGLSGLGKTRLVQALFDQRVVADCNALDQNNVIYTDLSDNPTPQPNALIESLLIENADTIVIIDNCGSETHNKLTELVQTKGSKLRLLTVEYDIQDGLPDETLCYRLEASSDELINQLLVRRYPKLSNNDIAKIVDFSGGNARVAFALADSSERKGQLSKLENNELFLRLFKQRNDNNENLLRSAEVCSLLYSFDAESIDVNSEFSILAELAEVSIATLNSHVSELQRRGLVQQRGKWKAILPHAISNRLAAKALEDYPKDLLLAQIVGKGMPRVLKSFSHRLGFLHESKEAQVIATEWLDCGGLCADPAKFNELGQQIFSYIAPVDQNATLNSLLRASECDQFISIKNYDRWRYIQIARALAYEEGNFDQASTILLRFALVEPANYNNNSALSTFKSLFNCCLSDTLASPSRRAFFVLRLLRSSEQSRVKIGLELLSISLKSGQFSSSSNFDFGAHSRSVGWLPKSADEIVDWYSSFISIVQEFGAEDNELGATIRKLFAEKYRGLCAHSGANLNRQLITLVETFHAVDGWLDGWSSIKEILRFDKSRIDENSVADLERLESMLSPKSLVEKVRAQVLCQNWFYDELDDDDASSNDNKYLEREAKLEQLGKLVGDDKAIIVELLPLLLESNSHKHVGSFAFGVAQTIENIRDLLEKARHIVRNVGIDAIDFGFVVELVRGWNKIDSKEVSLFLDQSVDDTVWGEVFPWLQLSTPLDIKGYKRLLHCLTLEKAPIWLYKQLQFGSVTSLLPAEHVMILLSAIANKTSGVIVATEILYMVVYGAKEKDEIYREKLAEGCSVFLKELNWQELETANRNILSHLSKILEFLFQSQFSDENVEIFLQNILNLNIDDSIKYSPDSKLLLVPFFLYQTKRTLDIIYHPDEDGSYDLVVDLLYDRYSPDFESPIRHCIVAKIVDWCRESPDDRVIFIAKICPLFKFEQNQTEQTVDAGLSEIIKELFKLANEKRVLLQVLSDRVRPSSWSGSLATILRSRIPLLNELKNDQETEFVNLIEELQNEIAGEADRVALWEEEKNQRKNISFE